MVLIGRIFDIVHISDNVAQIILRKKISNKIVPVAVSVFGYWKDKALKDMKLKPKDKIKGNLYLKSKIYNNKYYTDVFFKEIILVEPAPIPMNDLFNKNIIQEDDGYIDTDTGEFIDG